MITKGRAPCLSLRNYEFWHKCTQESARNTHSDRRLSACTPRRGCGCRCRRRRWWGRAAPDAAGAAATTAAATAGAFLRIPQRSVDRRSSLSVWKWFELRCLVLSIPLVIGGFLRIIVVKHLRSIALDIHIDWRTHIINRCWAEIASWRVLRTVHHDLDCGHRARVHWALYRARCDAYLRRRLLAKHVQADTKTISVAARGRAALILLLILFALAVYQYVDQSCVVRTQAQRVRMRLLLWRRPGDDHLGGWRLSWKGANGDFSGLIGRKIESTIHTYRQKRSCLLLKRFVLTNLFLGAVSCEWN